MCQDIKKLITKEVLSELIGERVDSFVIKGDKIFVGNNIMVGSLNLNQILGLIKDNK